MVRVKRIQAPIIAGLLLLMLILPQLVLAQPEISDVDAVDITATTAAITWITTNTSDSEVNYGTTTTLGNTESDSSMVLDHYIPLTGLAQYLRFMRACFVCASASSVAIRVVTALTTSPM